ncbi:MAG: deoxyribonuclease IV [Spirochaetes bacterium]|nr:deoxyribonuclease IV [Spirochaetota bacterium]
MRYIGAHVRTDGGVFNAPLNAKRIGANAFSFFTKNQRRWFSNQYSEHEILKFKENLSSVNINIEHVVAHDSYLINIGSPSVEIREKSIKSLLDESKRVELLGLKYLNFHPGSHLNQISEKDCIKLIAEGINFILDETELVILLLETTAGQGSNIGYKFEHLRDIIDLVKYKDRVGVCIDTCHIFCAGYEIRDKDSYKKTFEEFNKIIGLSKLKCIHINDSKNDLGSRKDRHDNLGKGYLGWDTFRFFILDSKLSYVPFILETIEESLWEEEIKVLRSFEKD